VKVIGDEPANTDYDPGPSVEAHIARRRYVTCRGVIAGHQHKAADHRGPCGEANRKAECRKSARSVWWAGMGNGALAIGPKLPRPSSTLPRQKFSLLQ